MPLRLNLAKDFAQSVEISGSFMLPPEALEQIREMIIGAKQTPVMPWLFSETYSMQKQRHSARALIDSHAEDGKISLSLTIVAGSTWSSSDEPKVSALMDLVSSYGISLNFHCGVDFDYPENSGDSLFPIPSEPHRKGSRLEIRGARFSLIDDDNKVIYSIIIDRPFLRSYYHSISFHFEGALENRTFAEIFRRSRQISHEHFLVRVRPAVDRAVKGSES
jgi:hypothetical protein